MARERPFSFLDHAIRAGDSLLGLTAFAQIESFHVWPERTAGELPFAATLGPRIKEALELRRELESIRVLNVRDAEEKERLHRDATHALRAVELVADLVVGAALSSAIAKNSVLDLRLHSVKQRLVDALADQLDEDERDRLFEQLQAQADAWLNEGRPEGAPLRRPPHWPVAFPEVLDGGGFDAFVGNPPFLGGKRISGRAGDDFRGFISASLANGVKGSADLVTYFFLLAAKMSKFTGFIATNTVAQGDTREVGLEQIVKRGAVIYRATRSRPWPGSAALSVAQVWMTQAPWSGPAMLDDAPAPTGISSYLLAASRSSGTPQRLPQMAGRSFYGTVISGAGFIVDADEKAMLEEADGRTPSVLQPYLTGGDLLGTPDGCASRWVINFQDWPLEQAEEWAGSIGRVRQLVKPDRDNVKRESYRTRWWQFAERCAALYAAIAHLDRVLVVPQTGKFLPVTYAPVDQVFAQSVMVLAYDDDFHAGLLNSGIHQAWVQKTSSTLETRLCYRPTDSFETFVECPEDGNVADAGAQLLKLWAGQRAEAGGLTKLLNKVHDPVVATPEVLRLREAQVALDLATRDAYGWADVDLAHDFRDTGPGIRYAISEPAAIELLDRLLELNQQQAAQGAQRAGAAAKKKTKAAVVSDEAGTLALFPEMTTKDTP